MSDGWKCENCGVDLTEADKTCPSCKSNKKVYKKSVGGAAIGIKASLEGTHETRMTSSEWTIMGVVFASFLSIVLFCIGSINLALWIRGLIAFGVFVFAWVVLWIARYRLIMFLRWVDKAFTGKRTFRG